jgi:hypothetical protein
MHPIAVKQVKEIILGSQYLGAAEAGVMSHPGFTGRLHLGPEIDPADFERAVEHLRHQGIDVKVRPQQPGTWTPPRASVPTSSIPTRT